MKSIPLFRFLLLVPVLFFASLTYAQDSTYQNTATQMLLESGNLSIRGYAEMVYTQDVSNGQWENGMMDARRVVLFTGYRFNKQTSFISELEVEHGNEIYIEQAFVNHRVNPYINFRAGVLLIPMGIVNEYHEPTTFHGVNRPSMDEHIYPTTWRELGAGVQGILPNQSIAYQAYVVNGFMGYKAGKGLIQAETGLRKGRQKAIKSTFRHPNAVAKVDYFGLPNLKIGLSGYVGKTQSDLYNDLSGNTDSLLNRADSSVLGVAMIGLDARYQYQKLQLRAQFNQSRYSNAASYNAFAGQNVGNGMAGYLFEIAYNVLPLSHSYQLYPFIRYEDFDTQTDVEAYDKVEGSHRQEATCGLSFFVHPGVVFKGDYQMDLIGSNDRFNLGFGIWF